MSSGQRKRVTFADLVSARLPSETSPPSGTKLPEPGADSLITPSPESAPLIAEGPQDEETNDASKAVAEDKPAGDKHRTDDSHSTIEPVTRINFDESSTSQSSRDSQPARDSQSRAGSQSEYVRQPPTVRRTFRPAGGGQNDSQPLDDSQPSTDSQSPPDRQPLREVKGYLRLPNTLVDSLLPTLDVFEQAVFIQLYRLSHGFSNYTCKISLPALQARAGVKPTSLKQAVARLQARGIVEKVSADIGFGREQGITYWVSQDGRQTYSDWHSRAGSQSPDDDNKRKEISKESNLKGALTPEQIKSCPDCGGVGMWYPDGPGKGVARCYHPALRNRS